MHALHYRQLADAYISAPRGSSVRLSVLLRGTSACGLEAGIEPRCNLQLMYGALHLSCSCPTCILPLHVLNDVFLWFSSRWCTSPKYSDVRLWPAGASLPLLPKKLSQCSAPTDFITAIHYCSSCLLRLCIFYVAQAT